MWVRTVLPESDSVSVRRRATAQSLREVEIDRAVYLVDDEACTYRYLKRNPKWHAVGPNQANKRSIEGYTRTLRNGRTKAYSYED